MSTTCDSMSARILSVVRLESLPHDAKKVFECKEIGTAQFMRKTTCLSRCAPGNRASERTCRIHVG